MGKTPPANVLYDIKQSEGKARVMQSTPLFSSLPGPLLPKVGQIEQICVLMLNWIVWNWIVLAFQLSKNGLFFTVNCV